MPKPQLHQSYVPYLCPAPQLMGHGQFFKGEVFLLPLAKGGGEGFYEAFFKELKCYSFFMFPYLNFHLDKD
ncbi:MAG: hypothetical protein A2V86_07655 [Deltaproteobacteria bacterium RBG_16_49_23]|nr:MAG: hypothetical protein A2V86_07655 [Deltaproteobacteria bacterium RBG_16_49_23]